MFLIACLWLVFTISAGFRSYQYWNKFHPNIKFRTFIKQGKQFESLFQYSNAKDIYQQALACVDAVPELRHQVLCNLAIVYARNGQSGESLNTIDLIKREFPLKKIVNAKIELPILASLENITKNDLLRAIRCQSILVGSQQYSLDDANNYLSLLVRYHLDDNRELTEDLKSQFEKILEVNPKHFSANYNIFRINQNQNRSFQQIDVEHLNKCIEIYGDHPVLVEHLFKNSANMINAGKSTMLEYLDLLKRYSNCGGQKQG